MVGAMVANDVERFVVVDVGGDVLLVDVGGDVLVADGGVAIA